MKQYRIVATSCLLLLLSFSFALAADSITFGTLKAVGVEPLPKDDAVVFLTKGRLAGEIGNWNQPLWLKENGTVRGESCGKGGSCNSPAQGSGKWSVDDDGTLHLFLDWGRWGKHDWVGKLYKHDGYLYQFDGKDEASPQAYRFRL